MLSRRLAVKWAVLAVICTAAVFLFPAATGPFTAVHGPATALRAWHMAVSTLAGMALVAMLIRSLTQALHGCCRSPEELFRNLSPSDPQLSCTLRC
jgi:hypothetical protein